MQIQIYVKFSPAYMATNLLKMLFCIKLKIHVINLMNLVKNNVIVR